MDYRFRHMQHERPGMSKLFVLCFNVYGAEEMMRQIKQRKVMPRRTKHPAQPIVFQPRCYVRCY